MTKIIELKELVKDIYEMVIDEPFVSKKARAGHFVVVMPDEKGERIPLTVADYDAEKGTITLVIMAVGTSTRKLVNLDIGTNLHAFLGPLGHASEVENYGTVIMVAGGVGTAPIYPIAKALKAAGNRVISIQGARNKNLLFWTEKLASVSDEHIVCTDDGSFGRKGLVTEPLKEIIEREGKENIGCVFSIGPAIMMKFCALTTKPFEVKTIVSLNSIMIDGTGMCGGCRVKIGEETLFTCVDGPEFDGHLVDWDLLLSRHKLYHKEEKCSLDSYMEKEGIQ